MLLLVISIKEIVLFNVHRVVKMKWYFVCDDWCFEKKKINHLYFQKIGDGVCDDECRALGSDGKPLCQSKENPGKVLI